MNVLHGEPFPTPRGKWSLEFWTFGFWGGVWGGRPAERVSEVESGSLTGSDLVSVTSASGSWPFP